MVSKVVVLLFFLATVSEASFCSAYACSSLLASNICGSQVNSGSFLVNSNGCNSNYQCSLSAFQVWGTTASTSATYPCTAIPTVTATNNTNSGLWTYQTCQTHQANKSFKNGNTLVTCASNNDCLLTDSTTTTCVCAIRSDGSGICQPNISNDAIFSGYWTDCGTSNQITNQNTWNYWSYYINMWVYTQSDLACNSIFQEIIQLANLKIAYNGSEVLVLGVILGLVFY